VRSMGGLILVQNELESFNLYSIKTLLSHAHAYGRPVKHNIEVSGKYQAFVHYILRDACFTRTICCKILIIKSDFVGS